MDLNEATREMFDGIFEQFVGRVPSADDINAYKAEFDQDLRHPAELLKWMATRTSGARSESLLRMAEQACNLPGFESASSGQG